MAESAYPYREKGPLDEIEWLRDLETTFGPVEIGRNHHVGVWVTRRKGLRAYAPGEIEGMFGDASVAGALLLEAPSRPWHYLTEPAELDRVAMGERLEVAAHTRDSEPRSQRCHIGTWVPGLGLKVSVQAHVPIAAIYAYRPAEDPPKPPPLPGGPDA